MGYPCGIYILLCKEKEKIMKNIAASLVLFILAAVLLSGCHIARPAGTTDNLIGEEYPDAESYQTGAFT